LDLRRPELHRQPAAPENHDPAGGRDRHHRRRRHPDHHNGRHRPIVRLGRRHDGNGRGEPRASRRLHARNLSQPHRPQPCHSGCGGPHLRPPCWPHQRLADRLHENSPVHRNARHDGVGARRRRLVHERPADRQSRGFVRRHRRWLVASHIFLSVAFIFHIALRYTRYGKFTYAIGGQTRWRRASRASASSATSCSST
jgi:hypothetical protein